MTKHFQDESYLAFVDLQKNDPPTRAQIEAYDRKYGPTRRGQCKELLKKQGKKSTTRKWSR